MTVRDGFADLPGLRLHYRDWGGEGPPLVLLHGLASNARIWDLTAPLLAATHRVFALDQRGHGLTDKPEDGYDFEAVSADLAAFLEAQGLPRPAIVGHSWGANVALQFAAGNPDAVSALIMVDGGFMEISAFPEMTWERAREMLAPPPLAGLKLDVFLAGARNWSGLGEHWNEQVQEIVLGNFHIDEEGSIYPYLTRENHFKILRSLWEQRPSEMWASLSCPALLISCERDSGDPRSQMWAEHKSKAFALARERMPEVRVLRMQDTIHDVPLQRPRELAEAIREFLEGGG
ncbi:MAG: alpha/beta hydrolase [Dehalococcoidia bacterium]